MMPRPASFLTIKEKRAVSEDSYHSDSQGALQVGSKKVAMAWEMHYRLS